jgi:hypothetical protein
MQLIDAKTVSIMLIYPLEISIITLRLFKKKQVKQCRYRPGVAQRVPGV